VHQEELRRLYRNQRDGEDLLRSLEEELEQVREEENQKREDTPPAAKDPFSASLAVNGFESRAVSTIKDKIRKVLESIRKNNEEFAAVTRAVNQGLILGS